LISLITDGVHLLFLRFGLQGLANRFSYDQLVEKYQWLVTTTDTSVTMNIHGTSTDPFFTSSTVKQLTKVLCLPDLFCSSFSY
jgi:hypothetical protein